MMENNYKEKGGAMVILSENNYEAWSSICLDHLLAYAGPWDWIKSGVEPEFEVPPLEIPGPEQRRRMPAARRAEPREGGRVEGELFVDGIVVGDETVD